MAYNRKQFNHKDFKCNKGEYQLKPEKNAEYTEGTEKVLIFQCLRCRHRVFLGDANLSIYRDDTHTQQISYQSFSTTSTTRAINR